MTNLLWLQNWYAAQTNGDWEHEFGVQIETLDNPGWYLAIDLAGTPYHNSGEGFHGKVEHGEHFWYHYQVKDEKFEGWGDPGQLDNLIGIFRALFDGEKPNEGNADSSDTEGSATDSSREVSEVEAMISDSP